MKLSRDVWPTPENPINGLRFCDSGRKFGVNKGNFSTKKNIKELDGLNDLVKAILVSHARGETHAREPEAVRCDRSSKALQPYPLDLPTVLFIFQYLTNFSLFRF